VSTGEVTSTFPSRSYYYQAYTPSAGTASTIAIGLQGYHSQSVVVGVINWQNSTVQVESNLTQIGPFSGMRNPLQFRYPYMFVQGYNQLGPAPYSWILQLDTRLPPFSVVGIVPCTSDVVMAATNSYLAVLLATGSPQRTLQAYVMQ